MSKRGLPPFVRIWLSLLTFVDCGILIKQKLSIPNTGSLKSCYSVHHTHRHTHTHTQLRQKTSWSEYQTVRSAVKLRTLNQWLLIFIFKVIRFFHKKFFIVFVSIWDSHCSNPGGYENRHSVPCLWCHCIKWEEWRDLDIFLVWQIVELFFSNIWGLAKTKTYFAKHFGLNF